MKKDENLDYKNLNALIQTARIILKLGLVLAICGLIVFGFIILEKTKILSIIGTILQILVPLFVGLLIAWLFEPLIRLLEKKKITRVWSTAIVYILFLFVIVLLIFLVVPEFVSQLKDLISQIPEFLTDVRAFINNFFSKFQGSEIDIITLQTEITTQFETFLNNFATSSLTTIIPGITNLLGEGFNIILGILLGFYMSLDFSKVGFAINKLIPRKIKYEVEPLFKNLNIMARSYVTTTLFTSLLVLVLTFIGLLISGVGSPLLFATFCGITNIIPYFGPYIGGIPVIIVGFSISPACGLIVLITIILVQFIEGNIIHPLIIKKAMDIHPIVIIVGLLIFQYFFGIVGMILATPIIGAIKILFNFFNDKYQFVDKIKSRRDA